MRRAQLWCLATSLFCFLASLSLPVLLIETKPYLGVYDPYSGLSCLLHGAWLLLDFRLGWLANPLLALALYYGFRQHWKLTLTLSAIAVLIGASSLLMVGEPIGLGPGSYGSKVVTLGVGFYVWMTALALPGVLSLIQLYPHQHVSTTNKKGLAP